MIVKEIVNHTPYTVGFVYGDKKIRLASRGAFNANHAHDREADKGILRIVDDNTIVMLAERTGNPNFIGLSDMLMKEVVYNNVRDDITFFVKSGFGNSSRLLKRSPESPFYTPEKNKISIYNIDTSGDLSYLNVFDIAIPENYFIEA